MKGKDQKTDGRQSDIIVEHIGRFDGAAFGTVRDATIKNDEALLQIDASHSGVITRNGMFYSPKKMRDGIKSFTKPYNIPILVNHDMDETPFGRVVDAEYADFTKIYRDDNLTSMVSSTLKARKDDVHNKAATDLYNLLEQKGFLSDFGNKYSGLGAARVYMKIIDPAAIEKIKDGRYDTMSVSFGRGNLWCLECGDYAMGEGCEHSMWDDNVLMPDRHNYFEISFVNAPADVLAKISNQPDYPNLAFMSAADSARHLVDGVERQTIILSNKTVLATESQEADTTTVGQIEDNQATTNVEQDKAETMKNPEVISDGTVEVNVATDEIKVENQESSVTIDAATTEDSAKTEQQDTAEQIVEDNSETTKVEEPAKDEVKPMLIDILSKDSYIAAVNSYIDSLSDEEKAKQESLRLTAELSDTASFLGPNESFIVIDEGHVAIGLALLDKYDAPMKAKIIKKLTDKQAEFDAAKAAAQKPAEDTAQEPANDGAQNSVIFDLSTLEKLSKEDKQKIFDSLYELCSDSNQSIKAIKQENIMLKFDVDAFVDTTAKVEDKFGELFIKVKPLIVDSIVSSEIAFGRAEKSELEQKTSDYSSLDSAQLLEKFDFYSQMEDNKDVPSATIGVTEDINTDNVIEQPVEPKSEPVVKQKQNKSKNIAVKDLEVEKQLAQIGRDWKD